MIQETASRFTVWVCAQGVCPPMMWNPTPERPIPLCACRVEAKSGGFYRYKDRVPVVCLPAGEVVEALEGYFAPQGHSEMHPADYVTKRFELPGHEGLRYV